MRREKGPVPKSGTGPFLLPVGDKEKKRQGGDDKVDKEDHKEPAHDIPKM